MARPLLVAILVIALFFGVWIWQGRTAPSVPQQPQSPPNPTPTIPNSQANSRVVATGKGPSGTNVETLAVGVGLGVGLNAFGVPMPASVLAAKVLASPTTSVLNWGAGQLPGISNAPPIVKGAVGLSTLPLDVSIYGVRAAANAIDNVLGSGSNGADEHTVPFPLQYLPSGPALTRADLIAGKTQPQVPNPAWKGPDPRAYLPTGAQFVAVLWSSGSRDAGTPGVTPGNILYHGNPSGLAAPIANPPPVLPA